MNPPQELISRLHHYHTSSHNTSKNKCTSSDCQPTSPCPIDEHCDHNHAGTLSLGNKPGQRGPFAQGHTILRGGGLSRIEPKFYYSPGSAQIALVQQLGTSPQSWLRILSEYETGHLNWDHRIWVGTAFLPPLYWGGDLFSPSTAREEHWHYINYC